MSNYVPPIETNESQIDAINSMTGINWYNMYSSQIDDTSEIDVKYMNIYLWQICNSTFKSMNVFRGYYETSKMKLQDSIVNERVATSGQEIAQTNFDTLVSQAKTYDALYRKFEAMHTGAKKLYMELYKEDFTKRKLPQKSNGTNRTIKDLTPKELADIQRITESMLK